MSQTKEDELFVKQLEISKHVKIRTDGASLDVHKDNSSIGVWLTSGPENGKSGYSTIGVFGSKGQAPYFQLWPCQKYWNCDAKNKLPFAFSADSGIQIPHPDGTVTTISLKQLSELAKLV